VIGLAAARTTLSAVPPDIATRMYHTGIDPFTGQEVDIAKQLRDRKLQRALLQYFKPENYFEVRKALEEAGRTDLIGGGGDAMIPAHPPKEALRARMERANDSVRGDHVHTVPNEKKQRGYRPGRKSAKRRDRRCAMNGVEPVVRLMLLCDDVERPADTPTKVNILGLVHAITVAEDAVFPLEFAQLTVYLALAGGRGSARINLVGVEADTEQIVFQTPERSVDFGNDPLMVRGLTYRIQTISIPRPGLYLIQFRCNGNVLAQQPLLVR
jgi:hypothetical protein